MSDDPHKQKILIAEDAPANIDVLASALFPVYDISVATNGLEALEIATSDSPPDLILLDIVMPKMDGYEVCRRLKANSQTKHIPIIFITSKSEDADETKGLELGAVDYITKPFEISIVKTRVQTHLELKKHRDHLESLVKERTAELEEANIALKVMLKKRDEEKIEIEEKVLTNIKEMVLPFINDLKASSLKERQMKIIETIETNMQEITSPFIPRLSSNYLNLTPTEIRVATLIQQGKSTKDIATLLQMSLNTVGNHRTSIRKKLGLKNSKDNLANHLLPFK